MDSNANITAGGPPIWRKELYTTLAILTFLYFTITTVLFYIRRRKISDIRYRPLRLNILNVVATTTLCVMFCLRTAFYPNQYPCVLINWPAYIGFFLFCSSLSCRVLSFSWVAKYNLAKLRISVVYTPLQASFNLSSISNNSKNSSKFSNNNHINSPMSPGIKERMDFPGAKLMNRLKRFKYYTTDKWLTRWVLCPSMILALILALVEQLISPNLSIIPLNTYCSNSGPPTQYIPIYILNGSFIFIICPSLIYLIYDLKDAYGLRNELMVTLISGAISYIAYFVIETFFTKWKNYFGSVMFGWITFILCHTLSITIPLIQSYKNKLHPVPISTSAKISALKRSLSVTRKNDQINNNSGDGKSKRYLMFEKVLEDSELFERYKACAAACFCAELIIFLQEYQFLKMLVAYSCTPSNKETLPPSTPKVHVTETGHISFPDNPDFSPPLISPSFTTTPCTKSIVETVSAATWIPMPLELRTDYNTFYETFFDSDSDLAINFPGSLLNDVKDKAIKGKYELTMYEQAREEVLNLLYRNTFERYLKMYGSEVERKGIRSSIDQKV